METARTVMNKLVDRATDEKLRRLIAAALQGRLDDALDAGETFTPGTEADSDHPDQPAGAYIHGIAARAFRGIGPATELSLQAGPGLTLVVGRNGSGKSSFAEAAEVALTGANSRWANRSAVVKSGWRNLHSDEPPSVRVDVQFEGEGGTTVIERTWPAHGGLDAGSLEVTRAGTSTSLEGLGITAGLDVYRPFLPYNELGVIADEKPSQLHDTLQRALGLDDALDAADAVRRSRLDRDKAWREVAQAGKRLAARLEDVDDDRARRVANQLVKETPNLDEIQRTVQRPVGEADASMATLQGIAQLTGPNMDHIRAAAEALQAASRKVQEVAESDVGAKLELANLLSTALAHHDHHGDGPCPVCGQGQLDAAWVDRATATESRLRTEARSAEAARRDLERCRRTAAGYIVDAPDALMQAGTVGLDTSGVVRAYEDLAAVRRIQDDDNFASRLVERADDVAAGVSNVSAQAQTILQEREDAWRPHVQSIQGWLEDAIPAARGREQASQLKGAEAVLKQIIAELRDERWAPIADAAKAIWETLRSQSSVEIADVALAGSATNRRVEIDVTVDGVEGAALGVMSQGELHALALSLFLPRATMNDSPFRFVLLDDPVQSMDPARVDGLARVLEQVSQERQVIVLTHDDRLAEAIRRLQIEATVLEVARGPQSRVEVRPSSTPAERYIEDARALAYTPDLPKLIAMRTVAGFGRLAIEAASADRARRLLHARGITHADIDQRLEAATKLLPRVALALFGDAERAGDVYPHVDKEFSHRLADALRTCNEGSHEGSDIDDLKALVSDVEELVARLSA